MSNTWKLSNYLFSWFWKKRGKYILLGGIACGALELLRAAWAPNIRNMDFFYTPKSFRSYDIVIGQSFLGLIFSVSFILLLLALFRQISGFEKESKGIYTLYLLPMKRREVYCSFLLSGAAAIALFHLLWLVLVTTAYFPIMWAYQKLAAEQVFLVTQGVTETGIDVSQTNGLFLAFQRSLFLSSRFPISLWSLLPFLGSMALALTGILFAGFYRENPAVRVLISTACFMLSFFVGPMLRTQVVTQLAVWWRYSANSLGAGMAAGLLAIISAAAIQVFLIRKLDSRKRL